ncbi:unnamed protein product [Owenia fusiformis]|uniref:ER-bound oxygenase mpaB/mpaB'/Rubber oxygenase catalytic domain-containing protein n=1 Tax=Owenia fusiformis TaxID=6347 RepID=A0A8S4PGW7_OWEFU|nr:unnamed protein product [Owenia fusiformis]
MHLESLYEGNNYPGDNGSSPEAPPPWMDMEKFKRGQRFFLDHVSSITLSMFCSLLSGLSIVNLLEPLVFTRKSDTPAKSMARYDSTFRHLVLWAMGDPWDVNDSAHKSLMMVRKMHSSIGESMTKRLGDKQYISQCDMGLVQSGFMGAVVMYYDKYIGQCTKEDLEDYVFYWRGIGYLLGIDDQYNICSNGLEESTAICKEIERKLLLPALENPPKDFQKMLDAYITGNNLIPGFQFISERGTMAFIYAVMGVECPYILSWPDTFRCWFFKLFMFHLRWCPGFATFLNGKIIKFAPLKTKVDEDGKWLNVPDFKALQEKYYKKQGIKAA